MEYLLFLIILLGLIAILAPIVVHYWPKYCPYVLALIPGLITLELINIGINHKNLSYNIHWLPQIEFNLSFFADGLGILLALMVSSIGFLVVLYAYGYLGKIPDLGRFYSILLLFMGAMLGIALSDNLILLFVFWELTSITSFLLIGFSHREEASRKAATQALLITGIGGLVMLAGFVLLGTASGTYSVSEMISQGFSPASTEYYPLIFTLIAIGAFTKSAQFPFHFWLPGAMIAPTPVSAYLHSATMVKAGIFLLARFQPLLGGTDLWLLTLTIVGGITMLFAAFMALTKSDLKQILAYTTISVLGLLTLLLAFPSPLTAQAFITFMVAHAMYKGALFMVAGSIDHQLKTREISQLGYLFRSLPITTTALCLAAISMAGLVPAYSYIAKKKVLDALLTFPVSELSTIPFLLAMSATMISIIFVVVALLFVKLSFFKADITEHSVIDLNSNYKEGSLLLYGPPLVLAFAGLILGFFPGLIQFLIDGGMASLIPTGSDTTSSYLGGSATSFNLSIISLALGILAFVIAVKTGLLETLKKISGYFEKFSFAELFTKLFDLTIYGAQQLTASVQIGYLRIYLRITILATVILMASVFLLYPLPAVIFDFSDLNLHEFLIFIITAVTAIAATVVNSRLSAIACLGVIGFMVATIYAMFSAPDLAMTQILVETLTVIVFALVIYRLPLYVKLSHSKARIWDAAVAISFGVMMTVLVWYAALAQHEQQISYYHGLYSYTHGFGRNVVNVILVDFRALDTLGEILVIAVAFLGVYSLLRAKIRKGEPI